MLITQFGPLIGETVLFSFVTVTVSFQSPTSYNVTDTDLTERFYHLSAQVEFQFAVASSLYGPA